MAAIRELDYTPNTVARSLAGRSTSTIGLVVADVVRSPFSAAIQGVESVAMRFGYTVILCNTDDDDERVARATEVLISKRVDGIVFVLSSRAHESLPLERLQRRHIPFVFVNHAAAGAPAVLIDNTSGTFELTRQLMELGHRRIGCIHLPAGGPRTVLAAQERLEGYRKAFDVHGLTCDPALVREGSFGEALGEGVGYRLATDLLSLPERPTALVCCNDYLAIGAMRACESAGLRIPHDVAVVGHDNISAGAYLRPALTTVHQPMAEAGGQAVQLLVQHIWQRVPIDGAPIRLPCSLVIRSSSGHQPG